VRVVVGADGDGAMRLLKTAARKRGIAFLPIPPYSPHLNPVESAIGTFKMMAGAVMLAACSSGGALTTEHAAFAATYVCYVYERFSKERAFDTYRGRYTEHKSAWELNTLTKPRHCRMVPWGTPGYAYVPKAQRRARGAPAYQRAEPVLLIEYQFMYTHVYGCLTQHNTIIHTEQVWWDMTAPLGVFLPSGNGARSPPPTRIPPHTRIFADRPQPTAASEGQGGTDSSDADAEGAHADGQPEGGTSGDVTTDTAGGRTHAPTRQPIDAV
jgi:hypothetical protein